MFWLMQPAGSFMVYTEHDFLQVFITPCAAENTYAWESQSFNTLKVECKSLAECIRFQTKLIQFHVSGQLIPIFRYQAVYVLLTINTHVGRFWQSQFCWEN